MQRKAFVIHLKLACQLLFLALVAGLIGYIAGLQRLINHTLPIAEIRIEIYVDSANTRLSDPIVQLNASPWHTYNGFQTVEVLPAFHKASETGAKRWIFVKKIK